MRRLLALACLAISLPITAAAEEFVIGSWAGWDDRDKDDGRFTSCTIATDAEGVATLFFSIKTNGDFVIYLDEQELVSETPSSREIALSLDDFKYGVFKTSIDSKGGFLIRLPYSVGLLRQFRDGRKLKFDINGRRYSYVLTDAAIAFPRLRECFENGARSGSSRGPQTVAGSDTSNLFTSQVSTVEDKYRVGEWHGWTNRNPDTRVFVGCGTGTSYHGLGDLIFSLNIGSGFFITLINRDWRLEKDVKYQVEIVVDERTLGRFEAHVFAVDRVRIPLKYSNELFDVFRKGRGLAIKAARETSRYNLKGSSVALKRMRDCYFDNMPRKSRNPFAAAPSGPDNPFKPTPQTGSPQTGERSPPPGIENVFRVGEWSGTPMTSKKTGAFIGCLVRGRFRAGVRLEFLISSDFEFMIGLENPQWRLPDTREFPVNIVIDGWSLARRFADTRKGTEIRIFQDYSRALVDRLHNGRVIMVFSDEGKELARYDLAGSSAALARLEDCFFERIPGGRVSSDPFSAGPTDSAAAPREDRRKPADAPPPPPETTTAERDESEPPTLRSFVARLLENAGMEEFRIVGREERDGRAEGASNAWTDGKTIGMLLFMEKGANDFYTAANDTVSRFADACEEVGAPESEKGAFGDGRQFHRWSVTCAAPKGDSFVAMTQIESEQYLLGFVHLGLTEGVARADERLYAYFAKVYR